MLKHLFEEKLVAVDGVDMGGSPITHVSVSVVYTHEYYEQATCKTHPKGFYLRVEPRHYRETPVEGSEYLWTAQTREIAQIDAVQVKRRATDMLYQRAQDVGFANHSLINALLKSAGAGWLFFIKEGQDLHGLEPCPEFLG